jgi:hypothetical protein
MVACFLEAQSIKATLQKIRKTSARVSGLFVPYMVTVTHHGNINISSQGLRHVHRDCLFNITITFGPIKLWKGIHVDFRVGKDKNKLCVMLLSEVSHHMKGCLKVSLGRISKARR